MFQSKLFLLVFADNNINNNKIVFYIQNITASVV
jgi:hypothetical protein